MVRVQNYECVARAVAANAYTKRDIENSFAGTQMFVQARNNECKYNKGIKNVLHTQRLRHHSAYQLYYVKI